MDPVTLNDAELEIALQNVGAETDAQTRWAVINEHHRRWQRREPGFAALIEAMAKPFVEMAKKAGY